MVNRNTLTSVLIILRAAATEGRPSAGEDHTQREQLLPAVRHRWKVGVHRRNRPPRREQHLEIKHRRTGRARSITGSLLPADTAIVFKDDRARVAHHLARTLEHSGRWHTAACLRRQVVGTNAPRLGSDHPDAVKYLAALSRNLNDRGHQRIARQLLTTRLRLSRST